MSDQSYQGKPHYFYIDGVDFTGGFFFPLAADIDKVSANSTVAGAVMTATYASSVWRASDQVFLRRLITLDGTPLADTLTLCDMNGNAILPFTLAGSSAFRGFPFPDEGIPMPIGGFGIKTALATPSKWLAIFSWVGNR